MLRLSVAVFFVFLANQSFAGVSQEELKSEFEKTVGGVVISKEYESALIQKISEALRNAPFDHPQYTLAVDRNPKVQIAALVFVDKTNGLVKIIGADRTSTGNPTRIGYFETPLGWFANVPANMNYRALGTKNSKGWRGLGAKGSRVWDLGWQATKTRKDEPYQIRLLVHATDPDFGESRLGRVESKGCVRISGRFNRLLDQYGVLDDAFERDKRGERVLLRNRLPVENAGRYLLVVET